MPDKFNKLMAQHDGESPAEDTSPVGDSRFDDPETRELLEKLAAADKAFASAADELLDMPVPAKLIEAIRNPQSQELETAPEPISEPDPEQTSAEIIPFPRRRGIIGLAIAAGVAAVVATNTQLFQTPATSVVDPGAASYAYLLQEVMETVPSGEVIASDDGSVSITPMVSFRTETAAFCREFMSLQNGAELSGVACRDGVGSWEVVQQKSVPTAPEDEAYRVAEGMEDDAEMPTDMARSTELSYDEEQAAISSGWKDSGL